MPAKRAILYARVSTPQQAELYSLEFQLEQERSYAQSMDFQIVAELTDDSSGRRMERDNLTVARQMLARNEADALVTWKLDRLHRSYVNTILLRDEIHKMGKELHYAQLRMKSGETAKQRLPEDIMALMAEIEADEIAERTAMGKRQKALSGKWIGCNKPPYGYSSVGRGKNLTLVVNEEQAQVIRDVFQWYVFGDGSGKPLSMAQIVRKLSALGIPTPEDHIGRNGVKKRNYGEWYRGTVYRILHQTAYSGVFYHYKRRFDGGRYTPNHNKDEWVAVPVPVIVDPALFEAAQKKLVEGRTMSPRSTKHQYLVGRRINCQCGHKMCGTTARGSRTRLDGVTKEYVYHKYRCTGCYGVQITPCPYEMKDIRSDIIDERVWQWVREEIASPEILKRRLLEIQQQQQAGLSPQKTRMASLEEHRESILEEMRRLAILYSKNQIPSDILDKLLAEHNQRLKLTDEEIARTQQSIVEPLNDAVIDDLVAFSEEFAAHLAGVEESFEAKRTVIEGLDVRVVVLKKDDTLWLKISSVLSPEGILRIVFANS